MTVILHDCLNKTRPCKPIIICQNWTGIRLMGSLQLQITVHFWDIISSWKKILWINILISDAELWPLLVSCYFLKACNEMYNCLKLVDIWDSICDGWLIMIALWFHRNIVSWIPLNINRLIWARPVSGVTPLPYSHAGMFEHWCRKYFNILNF